MGSKKKISRPMRTSFVMVLMAVGAAVALGAEVSMLAEEQTLNDGGGEAPDDQSGEGALDNELKSDKILPETNKDKEQAFGVKYTLKTFASGDCSGEHMAEKKFTGCSNSPEIKECPKSMWTNAFECKETEKAHDDIYNQFWSWGVFKGNFVLKLDGNSIDYKALSIGKEVGLTGSQTCFQSTSDIRDVFLENEINSPSCRPVDGMGVDSNEAAELGEKVASLPVLGSFIIVPDRDARTAAFKTDAVVNAPPLVKPHYASREDAPAKMEIPGEDHVYFSNFSHAETARYDDGQSSAMDAMMVDPSEEAENADAASEGSP